MTIEECRKHLALRKAAEQASLKLFACSGPRKAFTAKEILDDALDQYTESAEEAERESEMEHPIGAYRAYRVKYTMEAGEWYPPTSDKDQRVIPGQVRILDAEPDVGYTDHLVICSILRNDDGSLASSLWCIDPALSEKECGELVESLQHHLDHHHKIGS